MTQGFHVKAEVSCFKLKGEDYHFVKHFTSSATISSDHVTTCYCLLGVFDGHGGKRCAEFASKQFPLIFKQQLQERLPEALGCMDLGLYATLSKAGRACTSQMALQDALSKLAPEALASSFVQVDSEFLRKDVDSGTTATVAFICGADVVTANVGDSLAFIDCGSEVHQLSGNHRIDDNATERMRLEAAGGEISQSEVSGHACGPLRIWPGGLAMSRTIGDRNAGVRVTAMPSVSQVGIGNAGARVVLASDGLWDAFNNNGKTVCHRIRDLQYTKAAARLRSAAKEKRDRDDITVICCDILPDTSTRIPPAVCSGREQQSCQVWHPLENPHMWLDQWIRVMAKRRIELSQRADHDSDAPAECITSERNTSSQEGSHSLHDDIQCIHPSSLYEQVKRLQITCSADEDDKDWITVPVRRSQAHATGKQSSSNIEAKSMPVAPERRRHRGSRGRGHNRRADKPTKAKNVPTSDDNIQEGLRAEASSTTLLVGGGDARDQASSHGRRGRRGGGRGGRRTHHDARRADSACPVTAVGAH